MDDQEGALRGLSQRWATAEHHGDTAALGAMLTDDFTAVGPRGFVLNKAQWIGRYAPGDLVTETFDWSEVQVRRWGAAAVVIGRQTSAGRHRGQPVGGRFRVTLVVVHDGARWRIVGAHLSPMAEGA